MTPTTARIHAFAPGERPSMTSIPAETMYSAALANDLPALARLLAAGVAIDQPDGRGQSPLMLAVYRNHHEATSYLLRRGADPNRVDRMGNTALMNAVVRGSVDMVKRLLSWGADPRTRSRAKLDARDLALQFGYFQIVTILDDELIALA